MGRKKVQNCQNSSVARFDLLVPFKPFWMHRIYVYILTRLFVLCEQSKAAAFRAAPKV